MLTAWFRRPYMASRVCFKCRGDNRHPQTKVNRKLLTQKNKASTSLPAVAVEIKSYSNPAWLGTFNSTC